METNDRASRRRGRSERAFTMIELLTVIAIIAILAAILFPIFGTVREQARQSNTISNLHSIYLGVRQFQEDEGTFPPVLFGYAETHDTSASPAIDRPLKPGDTITPMDQVTNKHPNWISGYLYREHVKEYTTFLNSDNTVTDKSAVTEVYWPLDSPISRQNNGTANNPIPVMWAAEQNPNAACPTYGDPDLPDNSYIGQPKMFYTMDSMDIGPMLDPGNDYAPVKDGNGNTVYELHYTPDWTHALGAACDILNGQPVVTQLKYKNPPADRTVITYVTQHVVTSGSPNVIVLLLSGTALANTY